MSGIRVHVPRVETGTRLGAKPGDRLTGVVLASVSQEWIAVDLGSGALLRVRASAGEAAPERLSVVRFVLGDDEPVRDPARPEAVRVEGEVEVLGATRPRASQRLLRRLAAPERSAGVVLSRPGPSLAYVDLVRDAPSVALIATSARNLELTLRDDGRAVVAITWAGATQLIPVLDSAADTAARAVAPRSLRGKDLDVALGEKVGYVLVGLGAVHNGHAPKVCFGFLPR